MTNGEKEKAIEYFKWWKSFNEHNQKAIPKDTIAYKAYQTEIGFYDLAIKALEQEPILDKIRAEILKEMLSHSGTGEEVIQAYADGLKKGLEILDKYKAESEG